MSLQHNRMMPIVGSLVIALLVTSWAGALPPDPDNAALLYYQAFLMTPQFEGDARDQIMTVAKGDAVPDDKVRECIGQCSGAIKLADAGVEVPTCDWGLQYSAGFDVMMPPLSPARFLAFVLAADARIQAADGNYKEALQRCLMINRFARHMGDDTLISYLVSLAMQGVGLGCMEDIVGLIGDDVATLQRLRAELVTSSEPAISPIRPLSMEKEMVTDLMRMENVDKVARLMGEGDPEAQSKIKAGATEETLAQARELYTQRVTAALAILAQPLPYEQAYAQLEKLTQTEDPKAPASVAMSAFMPGISSIYSLKVRAKSHANAIEAGIIVCLEKARSGRLPAVLPAEAPKDPFTGKPFEYERTDAGFTLRCGAKELGTDRLNEYVFPVK